MAIDSATVQSNTPSLSSTSQTPALQTSDSERVPPLENSDRLTRSEFEQSLEPR